MFSQKLANVVGFQTILLCSRIILICAAWKEEKKRAGYFPAFTPLWFSDGIHLLK